MQKIIIQVAIFAWAFITFVNTFFEPTTWPVWFIVFLLVKFGDELFGRSVVVKIK